MNGIETYRENSVTTQGKGRLVVMLYDGAIKFLNQAIKAMESDDMENKALFLSKGLAIIHELNGSLDTEAGGEIAQNLRALYHFMMRQLQQAGFANDPNRVREIINLLEELNEGWKTIAA